MLMLRIYSRSLATQKSGKLPRGPTFGKLSNTGRKVLATQISENYYPDDPDGYDKEEYDLSARKNAYYYKHELRIHALKGPAGLKKALELFEEMKAAKLEPNYKHFSILIRACAKSGYTQRAFELYREYMKYIEKPSMPMVTSLINACAECPFRDYGLAKLRWLRDNLQVDHGIKLRLVHYNCLIKAYGRLNDGKQIEGVIEEMFRQNILPDRDTFNMLLIACASDKKSGTTLALSTIKRMKLYDFKPDLATYRLFLRCIRDCGLGSTELVKKTFAELPAITTVEQRIRMKKLTTRRIATDDGRDFVYMPKLDQLKTSIISGVVKNLHANSPDTGKDMLVNDNQSNSNEDLDENPDDTRLLSDEKYLFDIMSPKDGDNIMLPSPQLCHDLSELDDRYTSSNNQSSNNLPNLLSDDHLDLFTRIDSIDMSQTKTSQQRLLLFGGIHGFLENMVREGIEPCMRTFGLLLACIRSTQHDTIEFYRLAMDYKITKDVTFYDLLIRHASHNFLRRDRIHTAMYLMERMSIDSDLVPNITTYESLATACDNIRHASKLISDLESCGFTISSRLIRQLYDSPLFKRNFKYLNELILLCQKRKYKPSKELVHQLIDVKMDSHETIWKYENRKLNGPDRPNWFDESQIAHYDQFSDNLENWLKNVDLRPEDHPWEQFYVPRTSKRQGFVEFVAKFKAIEQAKYEALESGAEFGNLVEKAEMIMSAKKKQSKLFIPSEDRLLSDPSSIKNGGYLKER